MDRGWRAASAAPAAIQALLPLLFQISLDRPPRMGWDPSLDSGCASASAEAYGAGKRLNAGLPPPRRQIA
jgi:hypothetical protein